METIKSLEDALKPDPRSFNYIGTLAKLHAEASAATLTNRVPEPVRSHFAMAQNLLVYASCFYPLHMSAQFHALASVEFALRIRFQVPKDDVRGLKTMLRHAVSDALISDRAFLLFPFIPRPRYHVLTKGVMKEVNSFVEVLAESLPDHRNELAHGSEMLWPGTGGTLRICADLINQLFEHTSLPDLAIPKLPVT